jgi:hypothetical protein
LISISNILFKGTLNVVIFPKFRLRSIAPLIFDLGNTLPKLRESMLFSLALDATLPGTVIEKVAKVPVN